MHNIFLAPAVTVGEMKVANDPFRLLPGFYLFLAPAVTVGETEGAMDSTFVFFAFSFAYNFVRK